MLHLAPLLIFLFIQTVTTTDYLIDEKDYCLGTTKLCLIGEDLVNEELWNYFAGFWCYFYTSALNSRYKYDIKLVKCHGEPVNVSALSIDTKGTKLLVDFQNETSLSYIKNQFTTETGYQLFLKCNQESVNCCQNQMNNNNVLSSKTHCPVIWDSWSCFPQTEVDTVAKVPCSSNYYGSLDDICTLESEKACLFNTETQEAEWNQSTDYSTCDVNDVYERRYNFHVISLGVCIGFCLPAIVIFLIFENLRNTIRVILHRNLLVAICVRCVFTILSKELIYLDALKPLNDSCQRMIENGVGCRVLTFLESSSINCIYGCMFLDAFYLHKVIVRAFAKEVSMIHVYTLLAALTSIFSICWAAALALNDVQDCWLDDTKLQWIMDGFRIAVLFINTLLLIDIIRVMVLKLKHGSTTKQTMAAFRATIFLIPLFGLHIIVTANKIVYDNSCTAEDLYSYARYAMEGLQGIIVSILFCYANNEVQKEIKNGYRKSCIYLNQRYGWNMGEKSISDKKRATTATFVQEGYQ